MLLIKLLIGSMILRLVLNKASGRHFGSHSVRGISKLGSPGSCSIESTPVSVSASASASISALREGKASRWGASGAVAVAVSVPVAGAVAGVVSVA